MAEGLASDKTKQAKGKAEADTLTDILATMQDLSEDRECVSAGEVVDAFSRRGFGPLLILPSVICILPTGAIPGVPAICGLLMLTFSLQMLFARETPWLPDWLRDKSIRSERIQSASQKGMPWAKWLDAQFRDRIEVLANPGPARIISAIVITVLAMIVIFFGFIPFLPALFSLPVLLLGLGMVFRDGLIFAVAYGAIALAAVFYVWS